MSARVINGLMFAGRVGLASLFFLGAINKIANIPETLEYMRGVGLAPAEVLLPLTIGLEGIGGLVLALGLRWHGYVALALAAFTLTTNVFFHRFWEMEELVAQLQLSLFFKNVAIAGGLVFVAATALKPKSP